MRVCVRLRKLVNITVLNELKEKLDLFLITLNWDSLIQPMDPGRKRRMFFTPTCICDPPAHTQHLLATSLSNAQHKNTATDAKNTAVPVAQSNWNNLLILRLTAQLNSRCTWKRKLIPTPERSYPCPTQLSKHYSTPVTPAPQQDDKWTQKNNPLHVGVLGYCFTPENLTLRCKQIQCPNT